MRPSLLLLTTALGLNACAPRALYFHESTKVAFAADYTTSDSQPLSTSFGYKRRIVAVVPSQERRIPQGGTERNATNAGEALSLVSKFNVRAGASDGVAITNNFASGMAARLMTRSVGSPDALNVLMHSAPISVSAETGRTLEDNKPATQVVNERVARIAAREVSGTRVPRSEKALPMPPKDKEETALPALPNEKGEASPPKANKALPMPPQSKEGTQPKSEKALPMPKPPGNP